MVYLHILWARLVSCSVLGILVNCVWVCVLVVHFVLFIDLFWYFSTSWDLCIVLFRHFFEVTSLDYSTGCDCLVTLSMCLSLLDN